MTLKMKNSSPLQHTGLHIQLQLYWLKFALKSGWQMRGLNLSGTFWWRVLKSWIKMLGLRHWTTLRQWCVRSGTRKTVQRKTELAKVQRWDRGRGKCAEEAAVVQAGLNTNAVMCCAALSRSVVSDSWQPLDCSPPGSSVHGILQARILEWVARPSSRGSSQSRNWTQVSCIAGRFFTVWATREAHVYWSG